MMQHTQGSWAISDTSIKDESGAFISDIHAPNQDNPSLENGTDPTVATTWYRAIEGEEEANARLIASAPEMLKTLIDLLEIMNDDHYKCDLDSDQECDLTDEGGWQVKHYNMRLAIQAIAKATGQKGGE